MDLSTVLPFVFVAVPVAIFVVVNLFLWRVRKARWREAAVALNGKYGEEGLARCGTISGTRNGQTYKIETRRIGSGGNGRYSYTYITVPVLNIGLELELPRAFLRNGCDPSDALKRVRYKEEMRIFVTTTTVDRIRSEPLSAQEQASLRETLQGWNPALSSEGNPFRRESLNIQRQQIVFSEKGVIKDARRMEALVELMTLLAERIKKNPVKKV